MKVVRVFSGTDGESHLEDVVGLLPAEQSEPGAPSPLQPARSPATQYFMLRFPANGDTGWHRSHTRMLVIYLAGELEVEASDGAVCRFGPGDVTVAEDTAGNGHRSRAIGGAEAVMMIVELPG